MSYLQIEGFNKTFNDNFQVLKDINFSLEKGQVLSIIGSSGSGKTTLLRCLNFLTTLDKGKIIRYSNPSRYIGNCRPYIRFIPGNTVRGYIIKNPNTLKEEFYVK